MQENNIEKGWYHYDGVNNGIANYIGKSLKLKENEKKQLHILTFNKINKRLVSSEFVTNGISTSDDEPDAGVDEILEKTSIINITNNNSEWQEEHCYSLSKTKRKSDEPEIEILSDRNESKRSRKQNPKYDSKIWSS